MPTLSGTVKDAGGAFVAKLVRVYRRDSGAYVGAVVSNQTTGAWSISTADTSEHMAIEHDAVGNPYFGKLGLGLHFNGANGSTSFADVAGNTVTAIGNAQISTAQSVFSGASGLFDGAGDGLNIPDSPILRPGAGDFMLRFWQRYSALTGYQTLYSKGYAVAGGILVQTGNGDGKINVYQGASTTLVAAESGGTVNSGQWYCIEIERTSGVLKIRRDGTQVASVSNTTDYNATSTVYIGGGSATGFNNYYFNGYLDDLEFYSGVSLPDHSVPASQFLDAISGGSENALIRDRLVPV